MPFDKLDNTDKVTQRTRERIRQKDILPSAVKNRHISDLTADKITTGSIDVSVDVGSATTGYVRIDGANNRIIVNDGTNDRILIGYQSGGF